MEHGTWFMKKKMAGPNRGRRGLGGLLHPLPDLLPQDGEVGLVGAQRQEDEVGVGAVDAVGRGGVVAGARLRPKDPWRGPLANHFAGQRENSHQPHPPGAGLWVGPPSTRMEEDKLFTIHHP